MPASNRAKRLHAALMDGISLSPARGPGRPGPPEAQVNHHERTGHPLPDRQERLLFAQALEAVRCVEEGAVGSPAHANVGSLLGAGFPFWTGGALRYVATYAGGTRGFTDRTNRLADRYGDRHGERFTPPPSLGEKGR
jgi:hypothetical protein